LPDTRKLLLYGALCVLGLALVAGLSQLTGKEQAEAVTALTEESFADFVVGHPEGALVDFYTPNCPHCKKLAPEFEAAAQELKTRGGAPFGSVDAEKVPSLAKKYEVTRYPTMLWFRKGESVLELGPTTRTKQLLVEYVDWASEPSYVEFETAAELEGSLDTLRSTLKENQPPVIIGYESNSSLRSAFEAAAERLRGKTAFILVKEAKEKDGAALWAYAKDTAKDQQFSGAFEADDAVLAWAKAVTAKK